MNLRFHGLAAFTALLFASSTFAQTNFPEIEPNSQKSEATAVNGIVSASAPRLATWAWRNSSVACSLR